MLIPLAYAFLVGAGAAGAAGGWFLLDHQAAINRPLRISGETETYLLASGQSLSGAAAELEARGILDDPHHLVLHARWRKLGSRVQAGEYEIARGTTPAQLLVLLSSGRVRQRSLTIVEGWRFTEVVEAVASHPYLRHTLQGLDHPSIMARLGVPGIHPEGRFYPDTYLFPRGTLDVEFLRRAFRTMEERLKREWEVRSENLPLKNAYEALVLASIIEKETAVPSERPRIAGVFVLRLRRGMRLETDPSVIYGLGEDFDGNLRRRDLRRDTPYNTYTRSGLPPTPIAMPGGEAIHAALNPLEDGALFFVAKGDGSHKFSRSLREHRLAVDMYQRRRSKPR